MKVSDLFTEAFQNEGVKYVFILFAINMFRFKR